MAESSGSGVLGVLVGAALVIFVGAAVLMFTGALAPKGPTFTIELPKAN